MPFAVMLEGLDELMADIAIAGVKVDSDLGSAAITAAEYGVQTMQESHPYQDQTYALSGGMHVEQKDARNGKPEAEMVIPAPYAKYVDEGTKRNRPYPFTALGSHVAAEALWQESDKALAAFADKISR